jgi:cysteinyl-tRNA synthetase
VHNGFVNVDKEKMSKSLGNFVTVRDVLARNDAEAFRWFLIAAHYRGPIQFDTETVEGRVVFPGVDEAEKRVDYMYATLERLRDLANRGGTPPPKPPADLVTTRKDIERAVERAREGLMDDLNTPVAVAELGEIAKLGNELADAAQKRRKDANFVASAATVARAAEKAMMKVASMLGILQTSPAKYAERARAQRLRLRGIAAEDVEQKVAERIQARKDKDFARSDALRDELSRLGISLRDAPDGTTSWTVEA